VAPRVSRSWIRIGLAALVALVSLGAGAVLVAQAEAGPSAAQQLPPFKIQPGTFRPMPVSTPWPAPTPQSCTSPVDPLPPAGIRNPDHQGPLATPQYPVIDSWAGEVGADYILAWAGGISSKADGVPDKGALFLYSYVESANRCGYEMKPLGQFVLRSYKSLTITAVDGNAMTLTTNTRRTVSFDLLARHF
jgi:hypothetical protein